MKFKKNKKKYPPSGDFFVEVVTTC